MHIRQAAAAAFQSTCPARGTTEYLSTVFLYNFISIHVPREGHDLDSKKRCAISKHFNPRAPRGARPINLDISGLTFEFQSTCPARGTTRGCILNAVSQGISIHVPREGHDGRTRPCRHSAAAISIHVPREGHDVPAQVPRLRPWDFNPRAPRGARLLLILSSCVAETISIHVPREGHDPNMGMSAYYLPQFQSTCPARGTTAWMTNCTALLTDFNPRAPRGARPDLMDTFLWVMKFQSTCPARGTT
mgnify:FL=1